MTTQTPKALRLAFYTYAIFASVITLNDLLVHFAPGLIHKPSPAILELESNVERTISLGTASVPESLFLSKAFSETLQPSNVTPFYYRASGKFEQDDITITTQITANRFEVFGMLVERYEGPISVTVHITSTNATSVSETLSTLHQLYLSSPHFQKRVDIHLIINPFERQFNHWRNVARLFARTEYVMMLDVDFAPVTGNELRKRVAKGDAGRLMREGGVALVVPAFEYTKQEDGEDASSFPADKQTLVALVRDGKIGMFHQTWEPGHSSTNYSRYYAAPSGSAPYRVTTYQHSYEPYVIIPKDGAPWCDERFIGYGANKAACLYEVYLSGMQFYVLPDDFLIHQSHAYAEETRKNERKYNRKLYNDFREETCARYLAHFSHSSQAEDAGRNAQNVCRGEKKVDEMM